MDHFGHEIQDLTWQNIPWKKISKHICVFVEVEEKDIEVVSSAAEVEVEVDQNTIIEYSSEGLHKTKHKEALHGANLMSDTINEKYLGIMNVNVERKS